MLSSLSTQDLNHLYSLMNTEEYRKEERLFTEGEAGETMYIVLSGSVSISVRTQDGAVLELAEISEGSFFGEMSIFDSAARSATCFPKSDTTVLSLNANDFYEFIQKRPAAGISIMQNMLKTTTQRLTSTGAFLSDMVTWGEKARTRAITDDFTGLYNRRFLDQAGEEQLTEAKNEGTPLSLVMLDLDHFGTLNNEYGQAVGDQVILAAVAVFKRIFEQNVVAVRYGGDEFTFLLKKTSPSRALDYCNQLLKELATIDLLKNLGGAVNQVSASIGIAGFPDNGETVAGLMEKADKALYQAKEAGRNRAAVWIEPEKNLRKSKIDSLKTRNLIIERIFEAVSEHDNFLMIGHKDPDEDCISSMIAMALLINKFAKTVYLMIPRKINENFQYLLNISRFNDIGIIYNDQEPPKNISTVFIMDTPKPDMIESFPGSTAVMENESIIKIEIDHHLGADSDYSGDHGYCLVDEASSASELVGLLAFKLDNYSEMVEAFSIEEIFSRNFVLAVLTGIIGDSKMGKYLKTRREKWFYHLFSELFNEMLSQKTHQDSRNFSTMDQVFAELQRLSKEEDECFRTMMESRVSVSDRIASIIIGREAMKEINSRFDYDTIVSVARYAADVLAESSRVLSLIVYPDNSGDKELIQFRVRRSQSYKDLDLRTILSAFSIENGGGHPGAIGFRIPENEVPDIREYSLKLIKDLEALMNDGKKD